MSTKSRGGWIFSLRVKLLIVLVPLMGISLLVAMAGVSSFLQEFFHRRAEVETARLGQAVTSTLRQSMLMGSEQLLSNNLADLEKTPGVLRIWIIDKNGRVTHAADGPQALAAARRSNRNAELAAIRIVVPRRSCQGWPRSLLR